jgi:hypothetical protein
MLMSLKNTIDDFRGETDVVLVMGPSESQQIIKLPAGITNDTVALERLQTLVGADNVRVS